MSVALFLGGDLFNRKLLRDILEMRFNVVQADSAAAVLRQVRTFTPDLIIVDMQSRNRTDLEFVQRCKRQPRLRSVPVIIVSAHARQEDIDCGFARGCDMYVTKPIIDEPAALLDHFEALIHRSTTVSESL